MGRRDANLEAIDPFPYLLEKLGFPVDAVAIGDDAGDFFLELSVFLHDLLYPFARYGAIGLEVLHERSFSKGNVDDKTVMMPFTVRMIVTKSVPVSDYGMPNVRTQRLNVNRGTKSNPNFGGS